MGRIVCHAKSCSAKAWRRARAARCSVAMTSSLGSTRPVSRRSWLANAGASSRMTLHLHAAAAQRGQRPHPFAFERWRDDQCGHAAAQPGDALDEQVAERLSAIGLHGGEGLHDLLVLARRRGRPATGRYGRPTRSARRCGSRPDRARQPMPQGARRTRASTRRRWPVCADRCRSRKIHTSAVCSRSNSLTWRLLLRAVLFQWIRL